MEPDFKVIKIRVKDTDLELMKRFVELTDRIGLFNKISPYLSERTDEDKVLWGMRSFCCDVSWFNRDDNPYEKEVQ